MKPPITEDGWRHGRHLAGPGVYIAMVLGAASVWFPRIPTIPNALISAVLFTTMAANLMHTRELCERCIGNLPLNPGAKAERNRPVLKTFHVARIWFVVGLAVFVGASTIAPRHSLLANVFSTLLWANCFAVSMIADRHRHLQPWCPYCRGDDGGDTPSEAPVPVDDDRKPVPAA